MPDTELSHIGNRNAPRSTKKVGTRTQVTKATKPTRLDAINTQNRKVSDTNKNAKHRHCGENKQSVAKDEAEIGNASRP